MLIRLWETPGCIPPWTRVPFPGRREGLDGQSGGEILVVHANRRVEKRWCGSHPGLICFRLVAESFSWYRMYGSLSICRWKKPVVSRILSHNRRPTVPGVFYPDKLDV
jgi:hypothetical protein